MARALAATIIILLIGVGAVVWRRSGRTTPQTVTAPLPSAWHEVPAERNGWDLAEAAAKLVVKPDPKSDWVMRGYPDPWQPDRPEIAAHLAANSAAMAKLDEALRRPEWMRPQASVGLDVDLNGPQAALRELARVKVQTAHHLAAAGQWTAAVGQLEGTWTLSQRFARSGGVLIDWLVARAVGAIATTNAVRLLGRPPAGLDATQQPPTERWPMPALTADARSALTAFGERLADEAQLLPAVQASLGGELAYYERRFLGPSADGSSMSPALRAAYTAWWRRALQATASIAAQPAAQRDWRALERVPRPRLPKADAQGMASLTGVLRGTANQADRARADQRMTRIAIALRCFVDDHQRLPATLDELVTGRYLAALPTDPGTGRAIMYQPRRGLLYCVGADGRDGGGERKSDHVVELPFITGRPSPPKDAARP